jgi:hypothetical protein
VLAGAGAVRASVSRQLAAVREKREQKAVEKEAQNSPLFADAIRA